MRCKDCKYGDINFWGYEECWRVNKNPDYFITKNTAIRENHAMRFEKDGNCPYFIKMKSKWYKFWIRSK